MGVFSITNNNLDSLLEGEDYIECNHEPGVEAACAIIAESEENYNKIMKAVGIQELAYYEMNGNEMVYEAADIKGFIEKAKQFFINIFKKIQGMFTKFMAIISGYVRADKEFINKYKKDILNGDSRGLKYNGYNFTLDGINVDCGSKMDSVCSGIILDDPSSKDESSLKSSIDKAEDKSDLDEKMRGAAIGSGTYTSAEFSKEIFEKLRGGESTKQELSNINKSDQISYILNTNEAKKDAEKGFKGLKDAINDTLKKLNKIESGLVKTSTDKGTNTNLQSLKIRSVGDLIHIKKSQLAIMQTMNGALLTAIKDRNRQAKSICVALIGRKAKHESFEDYDEGATSIFGEGGFVDSVVIK